jgi:hypothetical protein
MDPFLGSNSSFIQFVQNIHSITYFERDLRNIRRPNLQVSVLFIRSRLRALNYCSLGLKTFFWPGVYGLFSSAARLSP